MTSDNRQHVSVLMPVFNGEEYLRESIESIRGQTFRDWTLLIADDGSSDSSGAIAAEYAASDARIRLVSFPHRGLVATLNEGVKLCKGRYIFRMDADDISVPNRLELQTRYLDAHSDIVVLGCATTSSSREQTSFLIPRSPLECRWQLVFRNCIGHPGVAIRASAIGSLPPYRDEYFLAEDFKLWSEMSEKGGVHVIDKPLLFYRKHENSISSKRLLDQIRVDRKIVAENVRIRLGIDVSNIATLPPRRWAQGLVDAILDSAFYRDVSSVERRALNRGLEIYIARYGFTPLLRLMSRTGFRYNFSRPLLTATNLARSLRGRALTEGWQ